ncbi:glucose/quinate/shikimate family membrane-bound PQQ-dependent dehydrogenase [Tanticharoenia sakaeratensis]|uniref:Membrane-bound glucose dehydrogenase/PQQ n=1 Tax=Tanticharoenia sakaeratensis NBRC 103193 TaxID=1231623 RepID=A0A0D6MJS3_9PROT|nr:glucose/quinate/shikimate family membrane-bound PQQ-dependent dehydrogenase [Tanticharoenia sakaeratensis]GAN53731.1 membrane-bound glucose dehydrogenase/PQQ [Tanticharoenia sakaeratensis NBRC 103193]GBQ17072.1 PQQ-dependent membrane-bound glucose dehydrogenase [Tanticharoenia sakaeratensis NBRC 103193]
MNTHTRARPLVLLTAVVTALIGAYLAVGGVWLLSYGDTPYYLICGLAMFATAFLLYRGRASALWVYAAITIGSLIWAVAEAGFDFWSLVPRGDVIVILGIWLLLPFITRPLAANRATIAPLAASVALAIVVVLFSITQDPYSFDGNLPTQIVNANPSDSGTVPDSEWHAYGRTQYGDRFSPLKQINSSNAQNLKVAWIMRTGDLKNANDPGETTNEATPVMANGTLYFCSVHQKLFAVDAATGKTKWVFDPKLYVNPGFQHLTCRGVTYHATPANAVTIDGQPAPTECAHRVFLPTNDGRMFAINADDGSRCPSFGNNGELDLREEGMTVTTPGEWEGTSPPVVTDKLVIQSGAVTDNNSVHEPSGVTRAYDIYTGKLTWVFDTGNPDPNQMPGPDHKFVPNSPNSWITSSYDHNLNLIYIPTGVQTPDEWGGNRNADSERYASGLLALNADTGKLAWFYQTVHHDLWDMDIPSQPSLVDITQKDGTVVPAIYAPAKTGNIFVLDRRTGKPIVPAPETPVPQGAAPGDHLSPTQPFSQLTFRPKAPLTGADMWGGTVFDQLICRVAFHQLRYEGPFTPPSTQGSLIFPGNLGMFEWGGLAVDPQRQIAIGDPISLPFVSQLIPRGSNNPLWPPQKGTLAPGGENGIQHNYGIPYAVELDPFLDPILIKVGLKMPCRNPPWGYMAAMDLRTNKIIWQHRNGTMQNSMYGSSLPVTLPPVKIGVPALGGPLVTAGNVAFLTASMDYYIRAYDVTNGKQLWQQSLPAGGQSTPMTYAVNGKQYIVSYVGGHGSFPSKLGDYLIAWALPDGH